MFLIRPVNPIRLITYNTKRHWYDMFLIIPLYYDDSLYGPDTRPIQTVIICFCKKVTLPHTFNYQMKNVFFQSEAVYWLQLNS